MVRTVIRISLLLILLLFLPSVAFGQSRIDNELNLFLQDINKINTLYPRVEGSSAENAASDYIKSQLSSERIKYTEISYSQIEKVHSFSGALEVRIQGLIEDELLIIIPLDHDLDANQQNSGAVSIATGLHLLKKYSENHPPLSIRILFLGAEHNSSVPLGSRNFLSDYFPDKAVAVLYLDLSAPSEVIELRVSGKNISSPFWLINRCNVSFKKAGIYNKIMNNEIHAYRLGIGGLESPINNYLQEDIPAIHLSGDKSLNNSEYEKWLLKWIIFFDDFLQKNHNGFPKEWDKNYLYFQSRFFSYLVSEPVYIGLSLLFFLVLIIYPVLFTKRFTRHIKTLAVNGNQILLFIFITLVSVFFVKLVTELIITIRGTSDIIEDYPVIFAFLHIFTISFITYISIRWIFKGPGNGSFYTAFSLLLLLIEILIIGFIDISFTYPFLWAFLWTYLFSIAKTSRAKSLYIIVSPLIIISTFADFLLLKSDVLKSVLFRNFFPGSFFWVMIILPFVLLFVRLRLLSIKASRTARIITISIFSSIFLICTILLLFLPPVNKTLNISEALNNSENTRTVTISGRYPIPKNLIHSSFERKDRFTYVTEIPLPDQKLRIEISEEYFLSRRKINFTINAPGNPDRIKMELYTDNELLVYNSSFPFIIDAQNNKADIIIGRNPPLPLKLDIVIPETFTGKIIIEADYIGSPFDYSLDFPGYTTEHSVSIKTELPL